MPNDSIRILMTPAFIVPQLILQNPLWSSVENGTDTDKLIGIIDDGNILQMGKRSSNDQDHRTE